MMKNYLEFKYNRHILIESSLKIDEFKVKLAQKQLSYSTFGEIGSYYSRKTNLVKLILSSFSTKEMEKMRNNIMSGRPAPIDFNDNILKKLKKIISSKNNWGNDNERKFLKDFIKENEFNRNFSQFIVRFTSLIYK